jgi:hypothetical protein
VALAPGWLSFPFSLSDATDGTVAQLGHTPGDGEKGKTQTRRVPLGRAGKTLANCIRHKVQQEFALTTVTIEVVVVVVEGRGEERNRETGTGNYG